MLACDETVTLIRCDGEKYETEILTGVSWYAKTKVQLEGNGLIYANTVTVRIPAENLPPGMALPRVGDHLVHGAVSVKIRTPAELAAFQPVRVMGVGDNRRGSLPHVVVSCQ